MRIINNISAEQMTRMTDRIIMVIIGYFQV